jgi:UPF0755 protein
MKKYFYSLFIAILVIAFILYFYIFNNNLKEDYTLYIPTNATYEQVLDSLEKNDVLKNITSFKSMSAKLDYPKLIKSGRYILQKPSNNYTLIRKLRSGNQDAVNITINNVKDIEHLAAKLDAKLEVDSMSFIKAFTNPKLLDSLHLNKENVLTIFIANTYQFYWNTDVQHFLYKMMKEYDKFWTSKRLNKAEKLNLSPTEVIILASIVQKESTKYDEYQRIAGVYYNRLQKNMKLQADPTVLYAKRSLGLANRVYNKDTRIEHPYNTYYILGLPPGPICLPETKSIDLCLDLELHNFIYFCAKEDFSGYHNFATDWATHEKNAQKFYKAMNEKNIR